MTTEEIDFEDIKKKIEAFKSELRSLAVKYNFGKHESDNYNGLDEFCGTDRYFIVYGETFYGETIDEIMNNVFNL